jgi:hypothetical protein
MQYVEKDGNGLYPEDAENLCLKIASVSVIKTVS